MYFHTTGFLRGHDDHAIALYVSRHMQASLDRKSNKQTGPSDEDIIKSFKK